MYTFFEINCNINKKDYYYKSLHSKIHNNFENEIELFKKSKFGIISCVYMFGEGFDCNRLNGVVIAENMVSIIRIVQYILRPTRLDKDKPNKKAYILIPNNYDNYKKIIFELRNVDEKIQQKIDVIISKKSEIITSYQNNNNIFDLVSDANELNKIILRLKYSKTLYSDFTEEEDEYNYIISINKELKLSSIEDYNNSKSKHINYIENPEDYFKNKGVWTNLYHFLGVDTTIFIQNIEEWRDFCKDKCTSIEDYKKICETYKQLPKEPLYFYKFFTNISNELNLFDIRRA